MRTIFCAGGRDYPVPDKTITARVETDDGDVLFFNLSDTVSEQRLLVTIRSLVAGQKRGKMRYMQPKQDYWGKPSA